jgi:hypothetical protein
MHQADFPRRHRHGTHPVDKHLLVGVGGIGGEGMDTRFNRNLFLDHHSAGGSFGLISYKKYIIYRIFKAKPEVIDYSSAHAVAGDDDGWDIDIQQLFMVLVFFYSVEALKIKGVAFSSFFFKLMSRLM